MTEHTMPKNPAFVNLTNRKFNRLLVIEYVGKSKQNASMWKCLCDCGNIAFVRSPHLINGSIQSCNCLRKEKASAANTKHGMRKTKEYRSWSAMNGRCLNENSYDYKYYKGRGITVCDRWKNSFQNFFEDMGLKPTPQHTIERINNELGYFKENCKWANRKEQMRNTRSNRIVSVDGLSLPMIQMCEIYSISSKTVYSRLRYGWSIDDAFKR